MDLKKISWDGMDWIGRTQDRRRMEGSFESDIELSDSINFWGVLE
jgi:hypothetical protein